MGDISESPGGWTFELWQEGAEAVFNLPEMQAHGKSQVPWMLEKNMTIHVWHIFISITPPKFNMEPENDGFQKGFPFLGTSFRFHVKFRGRNHPFH